MTILEQVIARMEAKRFKVTETKEIRNSAKDLLGWQVKFHNERVVTVYKTGSVVVQGRWVVHTLSVLGIKPGHQGRLP